MTFIMVTRFWKENHQLMITTKNLQPILRQIQLRRAGYLVLFWWKQNSSQTRCLPASTSENATELNHTSFCFPLGKWPQIAVTSYPSYPWSLDLSSRKWPLGGPSEWWVTANRIHSIAYCHFLWPSSNVIRIRKRLCTSLDHTALSEWGGCVWMYDVSISETFT